MNIVWMIVSIFGVCMFIRAVHAGATIDGAYFMAWACYAELLYIGGTRKDCKSQKLGAEENA